MKHFLYALLLVAFTGIAQHKRPQKTEFQTGEPMNPLYYDNGYTVGKDYINWQIQILARVVKVQSFNLETLKKNFDKEMKLPDLKVWDPLSFVKLGEKLYFLYASYDRDTKIRILMAWEFDAATGECTGQPKELCRVDNRMRIERFYPYTSFFTPIVSEDRQKLAIL